MLARSSGVLLHPTSLPGPHGVGDLGPEARRFVDRLAGAGVGLWQMLPVTAPGSFGSPYDCRSAFAGNWLLLSPEDLETAGLLPGSSRPEASTLPPGRLDLPAASAHKEALMRASWEHFRHHARPVDRTRFDAFKTGEEQRHWLADWALFAALESHFDSSWDRWPQELKSRDPDAMRSARAELADEIDYQAYLQFLLFAQFDTLRAHAEAGGVRLCGDLPMYLAHDSADVWAHQDLFQLDENGEPAALAGVPPDAFSESGQLWGNPVYDWARNRKSGFAWWVRRLEAHARWFDVLRLDHFRGFVAYWRVPAPATDARGGRWMRGPGQGLFKALAGRSDLDLVAEDLGHITPAVLELRQRLGLPGMRVLQFGFDAADSDHRPDRYGAGTVGYTGTHDNDTLVGWYESSDPATQDGVRRYLDLAAGTKSHDIAWNLIEQVLDSAADLAVIPAQDLLGLGSEARMNTPGTAYDNWAWRLSDGALDDAVLGRLAELLRQTGRIATRTETEHG